MIKNLHFLKKQSKALHLLMLMLLAAPMYVSAQEALTIYDSGMTYNNKVPVNGNYTSFYLTKCEYVIPAGQLTAMNNGSISQMRFYLQDPATKPWTGVNFQVFLEEVESASISSFYGTSGATIVYEGALYGNQSTMDVVFTTNYTYHGGNLLVGFYSTTTGNYADATFCGAYVADACVEGYGSSLGSISPTQQNFIPETSFTYTIENGSCPKPTDLVTTNVTGNSATLSWTQSGGVDHWDVFYTENPNYEPKAYTHPQFSNVNSNSLTLTNLYAGRNYYVYVRGNCGNEVGDWSDRCVVFTADQITLNDGSTINQLVPVPGYYVHKTHYTQFILPASDLQDLCYAQIRKLTFYTQTPADINWGSVITSVRFKEVDATEMSTDYYFSGYDTVCFSGYLRVANNQMTVTLSRPYIYKGGNLLVQFHSYGNSSANRITSQWLGVTTQNSSGYGSSYYNYYYSTGNNTNLRDVQSFLPKVTITYVSPDCMPPVNLAVSSTTATSATLSWTAPDSGQDWEVQYRKADETDYTVAEGTITNPFTLQGLESSHGYFARVRGVCGNDSHSNWMEIRFNTDCAPITLPYSTGFEDVEKNGFPGCWSRYSVPEEATGTMDPYVSENQYGNGTHTGTHSLVFSLPYGTNTIAAVLPQIPVDAEHPMNGNELVFYAAAYYIEGSYCDVGVMTDPNDPETFELVEHVVVPNYYHGGTGFRKYKVSFAEYPGTGTYIAIRQVEDPEVDDSSLHIDDLEVRPISDCHEPANLAVTAVTSSTATLQWTAGGEEISWQVQHKLADDEWPETFQTVGQHPFTLEGLTPGTNYQVRVRAACSASETSDWTDCANFITPYSVPFFEDFSDSYALSDHDWQWYKGVLDEVLAGTAQLENGSYWQTANSLTYTINGMTYFFSSVEENYGLSQSGHYDWVLTPNIELGEGCQLSFDLGLEYDHSATSGLADNRFAVLVTEDDGASWTVLALWDYNGTQDRNYYDIPEMPSEVNIAIPAACNNKIVRFAFYGESTVSNTSNILNSTNHLYFDNVNVTNCLRPQLIVASDITNNSASLNWTHHGETSWSLQYRFDGADEWTTVNNITTRPYSLTGLMASSNYQVRVKAHNATGSSEWSTTALFATECAPINLGPNETYVQTFEGLAEPACWSNDYYSAGGWEYRNQDFLVYYAYGHSNSNYNSNANLTMPQIVVTPGLCITFHHSTGINSNGRVTVHVSSASVSDDILWDSDTDDLTLGVTTISLNNYVGQTLTLSFNYAATGNSWFYLYDVTLANHNIFVKQTENGYWGETGNWTTGALPGMNETVVIAGDAVIPSGYTAQVGEIQIANSGSLTIADGGQLKHNNEGVRATVRKSIAPYSIAQGTGDEKSNGWYLLASPMQNAMEPAESMFANNFDLYRFNQSNQLEWENYLQYFYLNPYFKLFNGQGYLYANSGSGGTPTIIEIAGQLQPSGEDVEVPLVYDASAEFAGFNLVGNPFACNAYLTEQRDFYVMNAAGDNLITNDSENGVIAPMQGLFVQAADANDNAVTFTSTLPNGQGKGGALCLNLYGSASSSSQRDVIDRAKVRFGEGPSLQKFYLRPDAPRIYLPKGQNDYAVLYAEQEGEVPVNFKAVKNGTYTLTVSAPLTTNLSTLTLIDNLTGANVDLLQTPSYSFEAKATDYASRFRLVFSTVGNNEDDDRFAFISNGQLIVIGTGALQIFDLLGRQIFTTNLSTLTSNHSPLTTNLSTLTSPGVYVLRLINGDAVKTQKIVIP